MKLSMQDMEKVFRIIREYEPRIDKNFSIPLEEYERRYQKVWAQLESRGIDLGFFFWYREMPGDGIYMTGYNPTIERASGVIAPGKRPVLLAGPESGILSREVGLNLQTSGEFAIQITRQLAILGPLGITAGCLVMMFLSRKALHSWAISVFTLILPVVLLLSNQYPA